AKRDLQDAANFGSTDAKHPCDWSALAQLKRLDRYEQRVFTRRRLAIREFCNTKPMAGRVVEPAAALLATPGAAGDFRKTKPTPEVMPPDTSAPGASEGIAQDFRKTKPMPTVESLAPVSVTVPDEKVSDNSCKTGRQMTDDRGQKKSGEK